MATLSSSSTLTEVQNAYDDNASYAEDDSVSKANTFVTACRILLRRLPSQQSDASQNSLSLDLKRIREELEEARHFIALKNQKGKGVLHPSFENFRG